MGLHQNMTAEPVGRLELRQPPLCGPTDSVRTAIEQMRAKRLGCVIVVDTEQKPLGLFAESKLTQLLAEDPARLDDPVCDHLTNPWPCVRESDPIAMVLGAMQAANVRFIGVLDKDGRVVGLTGQKGLMEYVSEHFPQQVMVQRVGSPPPAEREGA
ncbi:CBS domain-containing protein [Aeoliella sp. ICT_H6.2]|uniref:CBS domain-containing protein n=1 Tax=Aeoliella straminimaris TaxID=2954799 RepID=A0A9X2JFF2_9BACT|nr:CBS domain-containing protein [Aeoliella straminimaris]MCO6043257.1 CBS domain-containing protein [Aeoliella straminimaris]